MINVIKNKESLINIKLEWDKLFSTCNYATPFQSFDFTLSSLENLNSNNSILYIITIKDDRSGNIQAIFPTAIYGDGILKFINSDYLDFCAPIINSDKDNYTLYKEFTDYILHDTNIKNIVFDNIQHFIPILGAMRSFVQYQLIKDTGYYSLLPIKPCSDDTDFVDTFKQLNSKGRKNIRTSFRKTESDCHFRYLSNINDDKYPEAEIKELIEYMISKGMRDKEYLSDKMLSFWHDLYIKNILTISLLYYQNEIKSCNFVFYDSNRNEYIKWIMIYKEGKWNMTLNYHLAKYIYNQGGASINFARGIYDYKMVNFHPNVKPLFKLTIPKTKKYLFLLLIESNKQLIKKNLKDLLHMFKS